MSPPVAPYGRVENIEASPFAAGSAFVTVDRHLLGDRTPHIFATDDFGATWHSISAGLPADQYAHVARQDPHNAALLFAGLEQGIWISLDRGAHWQSLQGDLPVAAVRDLSIQPSAGDLLVGTHGRGFYVLDDLTALEQLNTAKAAAAYLFAPRTAYAWYRGWLTIYGVQLGEGSAPEGMFVGENPAEGAIITYYLARKLPSAPRIEILDSAGAVVRALTGPNHAGLNRLSWNLTETPPMQWHAAKEWNRGPDDGATVVPGAYFVRLRLNTALDQRVDVQPDPRAAWTQADYAARYEFLHQLNAELSQIDVVLNALDERAKRGTLDARGRALYAQLTSSPANSEDTLQRPSRLRERIQDLQVPLSLSIGPPTPAQHDEAAEIKAQFDSLMAAYAKS
ncbi:MAG: hypothetical protein JO219_09100 [Candidatus Eremiobacteraeota bacterium]|nr:hypothetical protein [Candidatus Eremiobacteraeota bacterium]